MASEESKNQPWYLIGIVFFLVVWFAFIYLLDQQDILEKISAKSPFFIPLRGIIVILAIFIAFLIGKGAYKSSNPATYQVKAIDYIWYCGAAFGLILSLLDFQARQEQQDDNLNKSAIVYSHNAMRTLCERDDLTAWEEADCEKAMPILNLEIDEILEIVSEGKLTTGDPENYEIKNLGELTEVSEAFGITSVGELLSITIPNLSEKNHSDYYQIFNTGYAWLFIFASVLGIRLSKTWIEVMTSKKQ
ncbi:hypothetical protein [Ruegeria sp. SCSIO 43209]|uniref:hypothetical protein n=1 Tax=Ruegeria sp. SCSIO 43209 TaxID=2793010 RepID=UPI001CA8B8CE|nr:hypothetical protein [Ruegeria sp. SCSIO 43209]